MSQRTTRLASRLTSLQPRLVATSSHDAPLSPVPFVPEAELPSLLGTLAVNVQRLARIEVAFHATRWNAVEDAHEVAIAHCEAPIGEEAARLAVRLFDQLLRDPEGEVAWLDGAVARFRTRAASYRPDSAEQPIRKAARARGIPIARLDPTGRFVELGTGAFRRRIKGSITSHTPAIAVAIVEDKMVTHHYLRAAGLPVPDAGVARTPEQAIRIAGEIGYPVVVKPVDSGFMAGVFLDLRDDDAVRACVPRAAEASPTGRVLVEQFIAADKYRITVVNGRLVHASQRTPASVTGDGINTVRRLVEIENRNPLRGYLENVPFRPILLDEDVEMHLGQHGLDLDAIPAPGLAVTLRRFPHTANGGLAIDCTLTIHPENAAIFEQAARTVEADVVTLDVIAQDITQPMRTVGGAIIELNTGSGFRLELAMPGGTGFDPGLAIVEMLFPPGANVRAPLIAVCSEMELGAEAARAIAAIAGAMGFAVGMASAEGVWIAGAGVRAGDRSDAAGARTLLNNPATELAVVQVDPVRIADEGLGFDYCDVAVVLGLSGLLTPAGRPVETVLTDLVESDGALVLNADDDAVAALAGNARGEIVLVSAEPENARVREHVARGGRAVALTKPGGEAISLAAGKRWAEIARLPAVVADPLPLLAAVAVAVARGIPLDKIRAAITGQHGHTDQQAPDT